MFLVSSVNEQLFLEKFDRFSQEKCNFVIESSSNQSIKTCSTDKSTSIIVVKKKIKK